MLSDHHSDPPPTASSGAPYYDVQIDLTDDYVVAALFEGGDWEASAQRVQVMDDSGELSDVRMPKSAFRDMISVRD